MSTNKNTELVPFGARLPREINQLFDGLFDNFWRSPSFVYSRNWRPTEVVANEKEYQYEVELPRVKREEIEVQAVDGNTILVKVNTKNIAFEREFTYPDADAEGATVKLEDGVLTVTVPRIAPKSKKLEIK